MEEERDGHASDSSRTGKNDDDDGAVRWTVEEVSKLIKQRIFWEVYLALFLTINKKTRITNGILIN